MWTSPAEFELNPDARRYETWEKNYAAVVGLGAAVDYALDLGMDAIEARVLALGDLLRRTLTAIGGVQVRDLGQSRCGIVSFTVDGLTADAVKSALTGHGVNVSVSKATSSQWERPRGTGRCRPCLGALLQHGVGDRARRLADRRTPLTGEWMR